MSQILKNRIDPNDPINQLSAQVIDAAIFVHTEMGPGLLESVYEACMSKELMDRGIKVQRQVPVPVVFKGERLDVGFRVDLLVDGRLIVELKTVDGFSRVHQAQVINYLKLTKLKVGLLLNFNVASMNDGLKRVVL